jgi:hypothetical protein
MQIDQNNYANLMDWLPPETDHLGRLLKTSDVFPLRPKKNLSTSLRDLKRQGTF